jgi:hypothetical protein
MLLVGTAQHDSRAPALIVSEALDASVYNRS